MRRFTGEDILPGDIFVLEHEDGTFIALEEDGKLQLRSTLNKGSFRWVLTTDEVFGERLQKGPAHDLRTVGIILSLQDALLTLSEKLDSLRRHVEQQGIPMSSGSFSSLPSSSASGLPLRSNSEGRG